MTEVTAFAALESGGRIEPWTYEQRAARPSDVRIEVQYCGICHTDLHMIGPWGQSFPMVPGHEVVGRVIEIGDQVGAFAVGDVVAVGTIVDACRECESCLAGQESYCLRGATPAYGAPDRIDGSQTRGGYADSVICDERFVYAIPAGLDPAGAAPLLCAGITTYSPLRHWNVGPHSTVGIVGIGGLGHLGVKFARALGAHVVAFTTSAGKAADALALGAHEVVLSRDENQMAAQANRFDFLLDTVSVGYPMTPFVQALRLNGTLCSVGLPAQFDVAPMALAVGRRSIAASGSGGTVETREMLAFCAEQEITADVELVSRGEINTALRRLEGNDVKYRFVIDMAR
jgi:alcohol dehydrogenase (NADP+)